MPRFAISVISMKRPQGAREALTAVLAHGHDMHVFATSNGCAETAKLFDELAITNLCLTHFREESNTGFQHPHARAFREAAKMGCEFCLILNDDLIVPPDFLNALVAPMENDPMAAVVGQDGACSQLDDDFHGGPGRLEYIEGSLMLVRIKTIQKLRHNLWCPGLRFIYSEDSSLSLFVREKGFKIATVPLNASHVRSATVNSTDPETSRICREAQAYNHEVNRNRWAYYIKRRTFDFPIVVKREYAIGDVILTTPIVAAIKKSNPLSPIFVETNYPELFEGNPDVEMAGRKLDVPSNALVVDLNMAYENKPMKHILEAYEEATWEVLPGLGKVGWTPKLYPSKADHEWAKGIIGDSKAALICADHSDWKGKEWGQPKFIEISERLQKAGFKVFLIGNRIHPIVLGWTAVKILTGQTTLLQLAALCKVSQLMITGDSAPLHIAQAMGCPVAGVYGATLPELIFTQGSKHSAAINRSILCTGARHREHGKTFVECEGQCIQSVTVDDVWQAVERLEVA